MKKKLLLPFALLVWFSMGLSAMLIGQNQFQFNDNRVPPGERPPISLNTLSDDVYEPGKIQIKFRADFVQKMGRTLLGPDAQGRVATSNPALDALNLEFGIRQYKSLLHDMYASRSLPQEQIERHRNFGLNRWYELQLDDAASIKAAVEAFSRLPEVEIAEPVYRKRLIEPVSVEAINEQFNNRSGWKPNDQFYDLQWGFNNTGQDIRGTLGTAGADIKAEAAWETVKGNPDVIVAIIDGGIQYNHPDLQANMWPGIGPDGTNTTPDDHGTHVAGTVAAVSNNSTGVAGSAGGDGTPNSGVKLMSLDLFAGSHGMNTLQMNVYAADNGAAISQNSWGYRSAGVYNQSDLDGIDYFNAHGGGNVLDGGLTIFAAGNDNDNGAWYPAYYSGAMAVASTDNRDQKSSFSNYGSWVDISAPGTDIASTATGSSYVWMSGTSMACPHVSGIAALVLSYVPGSMSNQQLWDLLKATTDNIDATAGYIGQLGTGRLNALKAIEAAAAFAGGLQPPSAFVANAVSENQINLSWQTNDNNNPVLVAWSPDGNFGTPADGTTYNAGSELPGGGQVLYYGTNQSYSHTDLDFARTYSYRAWSYDGSEYSRHTSAQATTPCPDAWEVPFAENFNSTSSIPFCWETAGNASWSVGTFNNGLTGTTGNYAYVEITGNNARNARLITPTFDFSNVNDVRLEFKHRYNNDRSSATLAYSINGGSSWVNIQTWSANTGTVSFNQVIAALAGQPSVKFSWELSFTGGGSPNGRRSWSVDDISITGATAGTMYTIHATAGAGGAINPAGNISVAEGNNQSFTITPDSGFEIADVLVDGTSVGALSSYTFNNVSANHTISAAFEEVPVISYSITATAASGGSISPGGTIRVNEGSSQSFTISADQGYTIADVLVDGASVGAVSSYTFNNVTADHTIHAAFEEVPAVYYTITASAGTGGVITPSGTVTVLQGDNQTFSIAADAGYMIDNVLVNGASTGAVSSYTFNNVQADQTIHASFLVIPDDPCLVTSLPYLQDFNASASVPECWNAEVLAGSTSWQVGTLSGGLSGTTGNYAYFFYQGNQTQVADLISPPFDFSAYSGINLEFKHRYVHDRSIAELYYSIDNGNSWASIQTWNSSTANPAIFNQNLATVAGQPNVRFMWRLNYGGGGSVRNSRSWSIDDVAVTGVVAGQTAHSIDALLGETSVEEFAMIAFPNPASDKVYISLNQDVEKGNIAIFDLQGRQVSASELNNINAGESFDISVENLPQGMFIIRVLTESNTATQMIRVK